MRCQLHINFHHERDQYQCQYFPTQWNSRRSRIVEQNRSLHLEQVPRTRPGCAIPFSKLSIGLSPGRRPMAQMHRCMGQAAKQRLHPAVQHNLRAHRPSGNRIRHRTRSPPIRQHVQIQGNLRPIHQPGVRQHLREQHSGNLWCKHYQRDDNAIPQIHQTW